MKVLIIGPSRIGGGCERTMAYKMFLQSLNHSVTTVQFPGERSTKFWYYYQRVRARLGDDGAGFMKRMADRLEKIIKLGNYDAVISVETSKSYVFTRDLGCLRIFSCESLADEWYFSGNFGSLERFKRFSEMQLEILTKSDYVVFPWKTTENYARKYVWNGDNFITIKYGCYPRKKTASYFFPASIVSLGDMAAYWNNAELLSYLTRKSPYVIDVYGRYRPRRRYHLRYKGFAPSLDILSNYQFGLNTISKDIYRRNHFSSRPLSYLAYGLPVLSPDWMQLSHELKGCVPYNEDNFVELVDVYSERTRWEKLSKAAYEQAKELDWNTTLKPLEKILAKKG